MSTLLISSSLPRSKNSKSSNETLYYRLHYSKRSYKLFLQQATNLSTFYQYNCVCHTDPLLLLNIFTHTKIKAIGHHAKTHRLEDILRTYWNLPIETVYHVR